MSGPGPYSSRLRLQWSAARLHGPTALAAVALSLRWFVVLGFACAIALLGQGSLHAESAAVKQMRALDQKNTDFNAEIANQRRAITDMKRVIEESKQSGGVVPDINRLKAQGIAGKGVVGAGKTKPKYVKDAISEYESKANPQNYVGILRLSNNITKERNKLMAERRKALGLGDNAKLPQNEIDTIEKMAGGRAFYWNEIARSREFMARLRSKIKQNNAKRMKTRSAMTGKEIEEYKRQRTGQLGATGEGSGSGGAVSGSRGGSADSGVSGSGGASSDPKSARAKPDAKDQDRAKRIKQETAELKALFDKFEASIRAYKGALQKATMAGLKACKEIGNASSIENDLHYIFRRLGEARTALAGEEQRNKELAGELGKLSSNAARVGAKAAEASAAACRHASDASLDASASGGEATRSGNLKRLLEQLAFQASQKAGSLASPARAADTLAELTKLEDEAKRIEGACATAKKYEGAAGGWSEWTPEVERLLEEAAKKYDEIEKKLEWLKDDLKDTFGAAEAFELRLKSNEKWLDDIFEPVSRCQVQAAAVSKFCKAKLPRPAAQGERGAKLKQQAQAVIAERQRLADEARKIARDLDAKAKAAEREAKRATGCVREAKKKEAAKTKTSSGSGGDSGSGGGGVDKAKVAAAQATLGACQFKKSRTLISKLPEGSRGSLVARWNTAYETESKARDLVKQAKALEKQGEPGSAIGKLHQARNLDPCESTISAIDSAIGRIQQAMAKARVAAAQAALGACQFKKSRTLISKLPEGSRGSLVARWNTAYETESKARDLVKQAKALENSGEPGRAIGKLHQARNLDPCESTISAIDSAIGRIRQGVAEKEKQSVADANAKCVSRHGSAAYAIVEQRRCECSPPYRMSATTRRCTKESTPEEQEVAANEGCKSTFGAHAVAEPKNGGYKDYGCNCAPGYTWADPDASQTQCIKYSPAQQKAEADAWCQNNQKGSGWSAGMIDSSGNYECFQNKAGRNGRCRSLNGSGWYAGKARADGSFDCYPGKTVRTAQCVSQYGRGWRAGKLNARSGTWTCYGPRTRTSGGGGMTPGQAEAIGSIIGTIIEGMGSSSGGSRGRGGRKCHRRPDGRIHCGSN